MAGKSITGSNTLTLDDLQQVAQVLKSNGTDGELVMSFREIAPEDINLQEPVFIVFDGLPVPFYIESFTRRGNTKALVRLTDICSQEDVEEITGKAVYIDGSAIPEMSLEEDGFAALVGWTRLAPAGGDPHVASRLRMTYGGSGLFSFFVWWELENTKTYFEFFNKHKDKFENNF